MRRHKLPFSLDLNSVNQNYQNYEYMTHGGNQLLEILEKDISYEWIERNKEEIKISDLQFKYMTHWLKSDCIVNKICAHFDITSQQAKTFMYRGGGILGKLLKIVDYRPFLEDGQIIPKFNFMNYQIIQYEKGIDTVIITPNESGWFHHIVNKPWDDFIKVCFIKDGQYIEGDAESVINGIRTLKKLAQ